MGYNPASMFTQNNAARTNARFRVGINAHLLSGEAGYRRAGIHHYTAQVIRHLPRGADAPEYVVYTRHQADFLRLPGITAVPTRIPTEKRSLRILWEQTIWPWQVRQQQIDLLHGMAFVTPALSTRPSIITVYDLSFLHFPDRFPPLQRRYLSHQTRRSCRRARRIITISESGRRDVHRFFGIPLNRIDVVYPGVDSHYHPYEAGEVDAFRQARGIGRFLLHVGTLQPRKNIPLLLESLAQLPPELHLVLVGGKGWLYDEIFARVQALGLAGRVHFPGYVPDAELPLWYNAAELLVFPSVYEGFGMPVIEAMACGTPVVAAGSASIPEAVGDAGLLFDPQRADVCADRITAVLHDPQISAKMRARGLAHASQFSWEKAGQQTAQVYRRAMAEGHDGLRPFERR